MKKFKEMFKLKKNINSAKKNVNKTHLILKNIKLLPDTLKKEVILLPFTIY